MTLLFIYLSIAVFVSFLCSILEAVLLSITPAFINIKIQEKKKSGHDLKKLKDNIDRPLSAILTLNTFAHTAGAAGVGAQAQLVWGNEYLTVVSFALTLIILFVSEIIPKTIGAVYWKKLAAPAAATLKYLVIILMPAVWISQFLTSILKTENQKSVLSRADFHAMTEIGLQDGVFRESESTIIKNLLNFNSITVEDIMTPRTVVIAEDEEMTLLEFTKKHPEFRFSRIPVYKKKIDSITGFVLKDEVLQNLLQKSENKHLKDIRRKIEAVPEIVSIPELFKLLIEKNTHIAMVVDEYGGMAGIVTMEDIIETLLGLEITDELDKVEDLQELARSNWEKRAKKLGLINKKNS
ncbi:MAG: HlyC/CorC family transporter [Calditrichaeota bacterium]|nr:MAG: HlyC/CorC family transporter [Calditrichota bacterium]MBL1206400.1 HlyC/CorC family transporter [Calditrichota bacterium]NOG46226.1 HlyC/CorC family transporter [Calditrichota bacterium]